MVEEMCFSLTKGCCQDPGGGGVVPLPPGICLQAPEVLLWSLWGGI